MMAKTRLLRKRLRIASGFDRVLLYEFDSLEDHRLFAEKSIQGTIKSLDERVDRDIQALEPEAHDDYFDHIYDELISAKEIVPHIQWNSQFLIVYSIFEYMLYALCRIVKRRSRIELSFKDLSGSGIERAKNYLSKVAGVSSPFQEPGWQRVKLLAEVRNAIAHSNGEIELNLDDKTLLSTRLSNEPHLILKNRIAENEDAQIVLSSEFVRDSISELRTVLVAICNFELYEDES